MIGYICFRLGVDGWPEEAISASKGNGESGIVVAREYGYRDGSGVGHVVRRLERRRVYDASLRQKLARISANLSRVQS